VFGGKHANGDAQSVPSFGQLSDSSRVVAKGRLILNPIAIGVTMPTFTDPKRSERRLEINRQRESCTVPR
jgi:hypothetical protein